MAEVISLKAHKDYREFVQKTTWVCTDCGNGTFWLTTDGCIYCEKCKEGIEDLRTVEVNDGADT